jgi:plasmid stabilization system protein ParE
MSDIREIESYTADRFGANQVIAFLDKLQASLSVIAAMPGIGRLRPDLEPSGHRFRYHAILKCFVVVYDERPDCIRVARVLHGSRNLLAELLKDPGGDEDQGAGK